MSYRLNVTVPVGLSPPLTVAWSPITYPINVHAGCGVVVMVGVTHEHKLPTVVTNMFSFATSSSFYDAGVGGGPMPPQRPADPGWGQS